MLTVPMPASLSVNDMLEPSDYLYYATISIYDAKDGAIPAPINNNPLGI